MKTVLQIGLVAFLFGGLATAGTVFWQKQKLELDAALARAEAAEKKAAENPLGELAVPSKPEKAHAEPEPEPEEKPEAPVAIRPPYVDGADETSRLIVSLNQRLASTYEKEKRLNDRHEALKLIFADIRTEQTEISVLRKQLSSELDGASQSVQDALDAAEKERELLRQELDGLKRSPPDSNTPPAPLEIKSVPKETSASPEAVPPVTQEIEGSTSATTAEPKATSPVAEESSSAASELPKAAVLKRMGAIYDSMPADVIAEVFQQLTKDGRQDAVIQLLQAMKDRQAAKVLSAIAASDPASAATLTDMLKRDSR